MKKLLLSLLVVIVAFSLNAQTDAPKPPKDDYVGRYVFPDGSVVPDVPQR